MSIAVLPLEVLLVEDNPGDAVLVTEALEDAVGPVHVRVRWVANLAAALEVLKGDESPDCTLLDLGLPDAAPGPDGLGALRSVLAEAPAAAVVVLTGRDDSTTPRNAIAEGAQDYIVKSAKPDAPTLARTLAHAAERARALQALQASHDELAAFAHTVAHDLRSPLAAISGLANVLETSPDLPEAVRRDLTGRIAVTASRLSRFVSGLLTYAENPGEGRHDVVLDDVVAWVQGLLGQELRDVGGTLVTGSLPTVASNEQALRTIVLNLVSNAIKYHAPERPLRVTIDADLVGGRLVLQVGDNGRGIDPAERERVFALGHRATDSASGAGIGLSSVRRMSQQLGGTATIHDGADGIGIRVVVELPVQAREGAAAPTSAGAPPAGG